MSKLLKKIAFYLPMILVGCVGYMYFTGEYTFNSREKILFAALDSKTIVFKTEKNFLSVALDTSFLRCKFHNMTRRDWKKLLELSSLLSPAYLRIGGTQADQVIFIMESDVNDSVFKRNISNCEDETLPSDPLIITSKDWIEINEFARKSGFNLIFDFNVLLRTNSGWISTNAERMINFSEKLNYSLDFQLGNEPNSFQHVFNTSVRGEDLAKDFAKLKNIMKRTKVYNNSKLIGPDVTKPKNFAESSMDYLRDFLSSTSNIDVVSWHQYYFDGRTAAMSDFLNPSTFDLLSFQANIVTDVVNEYSPGLPIWISETSSAYGGGAPGLSDRYISIFLWLDKLGLAARRGMSVVVRQSLMKNSYALIDSDLMPNPDFWISFFYKNLVGPEVLDINFMEPSENTRYLRLYCHCLTRLRTNQGNLVIFGMNLSNKTQEIVFSQTRIKYPIFSFTFTPENGNLLSKSIYLNGKKLTYARRHIYDWLMNPQMGQFPLTLPPYSVVFWILNDYGASVCFRE